MIWNGYGNDIKDKMSESCLKLHLGTLFGKTLQAFDVCYNV